MTEKDDDIPSLAIRVDKDGLWYYEGALMFRKDILEVFFQNLKRDEKGRYLVDYRGQKSLIEVEDTPFVVERVVKHNDTIEIFLSDFTSEPLDPATLRMNADNVLYCTIRNGELPARFLRAAYYQIAEYIAHETTEDRFYIPLGGRNYYIEHLT